MTLLRKALRLSGMGTLAIGLFGTPIPAAAQGQEALQQAITQNPELAELLRQRIQSSGLTPDQVRSRLEASGYPPNLLDSYLGSGAAAQTPAASQLQAAEALGIPVNQPIKVDTGLTANRAAGPPSGVFGVDVFRRSTSQFLPSLSGPVPPDYKLGPGDVVALILTGNVQLGYTMSVTRYGFILIPQVGEVYVANLTLDQVREVLYTKLGQVYSGIRRGRDATTRFDVFVSSTHANQIYVVGEVVQPGAYRIGALGTVLTALYVAGGITETGNTRRVEVRRAGQSVAAFDLYDYLLDADTRNDVRLQDGDIVFVPMHGTRVQILGAVRRPGTYELTTGETLADLVHVAAGFRPDAALDRLTIHRILPPATRGPGPANRAALDVVLTRPAGGNRPAADQSDPPPPASTHTAATRGAEPTATNVIAAVVPSLPLADGDSVIVETLPELAQSYYVSIAGRVAKPGVYPWRAGITLRDLVHLAHGPLVGADLTQAEIARLPAERKPGQLATTVRIPLDSSYAPEREGTLSANRTEVPLQPYDNVLILRQEAFELQREVFVGGEVRSPGTYSLRSKDERLADVIERAGGLTAHAYPEGIYFVRGSGGTGRINIDLPKALHDRKSGSNVVLQSNDSIFIPEFRPNVKVSGAVNAPGSVLWKKGADLNYYISAAGGVTDKAEKDKASVRLANGETLMAQGWFIFHHSPEPGPGAEVFVPARTEPRGPSTAPAVWAAVTQVMASLVAITALIVTRK